jgi:hypothetical protein
VLKHYFGMDPSQSSRDGISPRVNLLRLVVAFLGLALCWLIVTRSVAAFLATTAPRFALVLNPHESKALLSLVEAEISLASAKNGKAEGSQLSPQRLTTLRGQVQAALATNPLSPKAYRLLGQIFELQGSVQEAEKFMLVATRYSLNESLAVDWLMRKNFERKNFRTAAFYADVMLRSTGRMSSVMPVLARMAEDEIARREVEKILSANASWRPSFFNTLGPYLTDARTPLLLFQALKDGNSPPTIKELNAYQAFLFRNKLYELAYYVFLQFLPPHELEAAGFLVNGGFETRPSGSPFDWQWSGGANVILQLAQRPENPKGKGLLVELGPGRVEFPRVTQAVVLTPGEYLLKGALTGKVVGSRGLQWGISCLGGPTIGTSEMILGSFPDWRAFQFRFIVPEAKCSAQMVQLNLPARSLSEQLVSGEIWFDDIAIARADVITPN